MGNIAIGIDLGSRRIGVVAARLGLPLEVIASAVVDVPPDADRDPSLLRAPIDHILECVDRVTPAIVLVERTRLYGGGMSTAALIAVATAVAICGMELAILTDRLAAQGIQVTHMAHATWAHRLVPHTRSVTTELHSRAVRAHLAPGCHLHSQDELDAAGLILGHLLAPAPAPPKVPREVHQPAPRVRAAPSPPSPEQAAALSARAAQRYLEQRAVPRGPHVPRRANACRLCGGPRRGHLRGLPCPRSTPEVE